MPAIDRSLERLQVPMGASPAAAVRKSDGSVDRDGVRQMLWELGMSSTDDVSREFFEVLF